MSDDQTVTEREAVLRERKAFLLGVERGAYLPGATMSWWNGEAVQRYPLPSSTRPRVVNDRDYQWRYVNNVMQVRSKSLGGDWGVAVNCTPTPERIRLWADLLSNPTEDVTEEVTE